MDEKKNDEFGCIYFYVESRAGHFRSIGVGGNNLGYFTGYEI